MRSRSKVHVVPTEEAPSTDAMLRAVTSALRGDRKQLRRLKGEARKRLEDRVRAGTGKELDDALAQLRGGKASKGPPAAVEPIKASAPRGARLGAPVPVPPPTPRPVRIRLPSGRSVEGHLAPAAARRDDLERMRVVTDSNTARAYAAIQHNARAIDGLAKSQRELAEIVAELQARGDPELLQGLFDAVSKLELRFGKCARSQSRALASHKRTVSRQQGSLRKELRLQARGARIQKLSAAATTMQTAAFGTRGNPLAKNNLLLAGNELLWGFFGDLLQGLGLKAPGQTSAWGWLAPVASLAVGQLALGSQQHQRFVSGVAERFDVIGLRGTYILSLEGRIAPALWPSFRQRDDVPVTATPVGFYPTLSISAQVNKGVLVIIIGSIEISHSGLVAARIAWMVDTGESNG